MHIACEICGLVAVTESQCTEDEHDDEDEDDSKFRNLNLTGACRESGSIGVDNDREDDDTASDHLPHKISDAHED